MNTRTEMTQFQFHTHTVRIFPVADGASFIAVATDVARALGYRDANHMVRCVDAEDVGYTVVGTTSGDQKMLTVTESGVYAATFRSRKPSAKAFRRWVTAEVLPSIRRTGAYAHPQAEEARPAEAQMMAQVMAQVMAMAQEVGGLRDKLDAMTQRAFGLHGKLDGARCGQIAAQRAHLVAVKALASMRQAQAVQAGIDEVIRMEEAGVPRDEIAHITGKTRNYIRQIIYRHNARRARAEAPTPQAELALV